MHEQVFLTVHRTQPGYLVSCTRLRDDMQRRTNRTANRTPRSRDKTSLTPLTSAVQVHTSEEEKREKKVVVLKLCRITQACEYKLE